MLILNIIPESLKTDISFRSVYLSIKNVFYIISIFVVLYSIILLLAFLILQFEFIKTVEETTLVTKNTENYNRNVRSINKQITAVTKIQDESILWSALLAYISKNIPDGIVLSQLRIDKTSNSVFFQGKAATREQLLALKENFQQSKIFSEINFPIKNLLEKNNINFEISAKIISFEF